MDYNNRLRMICLTSACERFSSEELPEVEKFVELELEMIAGICDGAKDFLDMSRFMKKLKKYYKNLSGKLWCGFRGGINSSIVAYLCDITETRPENEDYSWTYFANRECVFFDMNVTAGLYDRIRSYFNLEIPVCVKLHLCADITIFENMNEPQVIYSDETCAQILTEFWEKCDGDRLNNRIQYLYYFRKKTVPEIIQIYDWLKDNKKLPKTREQLRRMVGFILSSYKDKELTHKGLLEEYGEQVYERIVSSPESIYDALIKNGSSKYKAVTIASNVYSQRKKLTLDNMIDVTNYCGEEYKDVLDGIGRLLCGSHCNVISDCIIHMMDMMNRNFPKYKLIYDSLLGRD